MGAWVKRGTDFDWDTVERNNFEWVEPVIPQFELTVTDNPVVAELLGPDGEPVTIWQEREPFGFRVR
jgi:hypothetical protein